MRRGVDRKEFRQVERSLSLNREVQDLINFIFRHQGAEQSLPADPPECDVSVGRGLCRPAVCAQGVPPQRCHLESHRSVSHQFRSQCVCVCVCVCVCACLLSVCWAVTAFSTTAQGFPPRPWLSSVSLDGNVRLHRICQSSQFAIFQRGTFTPFLMVFFGCIFTPSSST